MERFINNRPFKSLNELSDQIYQVEKIKTFFYHPARRTYNVANYKFFSSFGNPNRYELIETDTDNFYLAISDENNYCDAG